jgi:hypothetical protein
VDGADGLGKDLDGSRWNAEGLENGLLIVAVDPRCVVRMCVAK